MVNRTRPTTCRWCGKPIPHPEGPGRPRQFCIRSHRQRYYHWSQLVGLRVSLPQIAERTRWACGICGGQVDPNGLDGLRPSIDHIVPGSLGGPSLLSNLQISHMACNVLKRNQIDFSCPPIGTQVEPADVQLSLFTPLQEGS